LAVGDARADENVLGSRLRICCVLCVVVGGSGLENASGPLYMEGSLGLRLRLDQLVLDLAFLPEDVSLARECQLVLVMVVVACVFTPVLIGIKRSNKVLALSRDAFSYCPEWSGRSDARDVLFAGDGGGDKCLIVIKHTITCIPLGRGVRSRGCRNSNANPVYLRTLA